MSRRVLIFAPSFPPNDSVDMHRVRMNVRHYPENGFVPTVLTVDPALTGLQTDDRLLKTLPRHLEIKRASAIPTSLTRVFGASSLALRAYLSLARMGEALLSRDRFDLVFFSTTQFLTMQLGPRWLDRFGVPFVLDFQDPWYTAPETSVAQRRSGIKHKLMRALHARGEARTVPRASGIITVSEEYITALAKAYPSVSSLPVETIPFGFAPTDFDAAQSFGQAWIPFIDTKTTLLYAGAVNSSMKSSAQTLFEVMRVASEIGAEPLSSLSVGFLGTGYQKTGNSAAVQGLARSAGVAERVREQPDRIPLLDALAGVLEADLLLLLGSDDLAYQPSKLHQLLATRRPILCVAPSAGRLAAQVQGLETVVFLPSDEQPDAYGTRKLAERLGALLALGRDDPAFDERAMYTDQFSAEILAARECVLFEAAVKRHEVINQNEN